MLDFAYPDAYHWDVNEKQATVATYLTGILLTILVSYSLYCVLVLPFTG